ncbi:MAG: 2-oxoacid:acceptor oxidoreductase subunit alpha [Gammaproteobacteria bacterium]|nr:2-oxoacid:acceptor oxidoreductase subunit alpha [Gammaproteobacteria bacterium]MDE0252584.1 2-oxoacid:acceptor oxidoreductase subunit alpha [Gammaproteobacteria bacterium]MDE0403546.1 2-oxoacid:acceptor oxidoreductase subunit alpha [Gammaproteobacteria bacterium]
MTVFNEFTIRFANVNGSGSASANTMFAKALFRMGIPVSIRNIFPSNIQGLPTWFEVRATEREFFGRREHVDIMVAMNAETYEQDVASLASGGYLLYDSTRSIPSELQRDDLELIGVPIMRLIHPEFTDPKQRQLFKNIVYVGVLSALLNMEFDVLTNMVSAQYRGKDQLIQPNIKALNLGRQYAETYLSCPIDIQVRRSDAVGNRILIDGNQATALGCIYGGATICAWYPITPSTSVAESFERHASRLRIEPETELKKYVVIQAEDELAALGTVIGAGWNGARAFTATSGPGISLMNEFLGLAYFAEIPAVIFDVQRAGPSTGMPTRTQQSDLLSVAFASHGDTKHPMLFPSTPTECFDIAALAFDLAEEIQSPVVVMSDLELGMNELTTDELEWDDARTYRRGKVLDAEQLEGIEKFGRYLDRDGDGIGYRTLPGTHRDKGAFFTRGSSRDEFAVYTEDPGAYTRNMDRLLKKWETLRSLMPESVIQNNDSNYGIMYYGTTSTPMNEVLSVLQDEGIELDTLRIRSFPTGNEVLEFINVHDLVFLVEQNRDAQMKTLLINDLGIPAEKIFSILYYGGMSISVDFVADRILPILNELKVEVHS